MRAALARARVPGEGDGPQPWAVDACRGSATRKMNLTDTDVAYYAECCRLLDGLDALEKSIKPQAGRVAGRPGFVRRAQAG